MATRQSSRERSRGSIERRGASLRVKVYAGVDPLTGRRRYLSDSTTDEKEAERILTRLLAEVDEQRHAQTNARLGYVIDEWLKVQELDDATRETYEMYIRRYVKPVLGDMPVPKVSPRVLEQFYAELRRCRARCDGTPAVDHRTERPHECRVVRHRRPPGRPPAAGYPPHNCRDAGCKVTECPPHHCQPLANASILKVHFIISGALTAAVRWEWIRANPAALAKKPRQPKPQPKPPTTAEAAQIMEAAWNEDADWGTLVWLVMVTAPRRSELLALRWRLNVDLDTAALSFYDTKNGTMRRVAIDPTTVDILREHRKRYETKVQQLGLEPLDDAYLFSYSPTHDKPCNPSGITHRYGRMCAKLGIDSHLHALRHYSATELLAAGMELPAVAGRLGNHPNTLVRVYAAWLHSSDRKAAEILSGQLEHPLNR